MTKVTESKEPKVDLLKAREEGLTLLTPLQKAVASITVCDDATYIQADEVLNRISRAEKDWDSKITPGIDHIRKGLDLLYDLRSSVADPLKRAKIALKDKMRDYKQIELNRIRAEEEAKQKEIQRLEAEAREKEKLLNSAKSQPLKTKLIQQRAKAEQDVADLRATKAPVALKGKASQTRTRKVWRLDDLALLMMYIIENGDEDLTSLVEVNQVQMNSYMSIKDPKVGPWLPGVSVVEELDIVSRASHG